MAEWYESNTVVRNVAKTMADEFKRARVGCCDDGAGGSSDSGDETPQDQFNDAQDEATDRLGIFGTAISTLVNPLRKVRDAIDAAFGDVLRRAAYDFEEAMASSIEANKTWRSQMYAMRLGDTAANINKLSVAARQSMLAMGGMETWTTRIGNAHKEYFGFIGDTAETTQYLGKQMQLLGEFGMEPSMDVMHDITKIAGGTSKSLKDITVDLAKLGIPVQEQQEMLREILSDENVQAKLRAANSSKERTAITRNLMARQAEYRALGMTKEQALSAGKALEAMAGKKPMDRYKMAAKATAALSAMGIEGAARVGDIIRMGQRASKEDKEFAAERGAMAQDRLDESKLLGKGYEFTISQIYDQGGLADIFGANGMFSTKIKQTIAVQDELIKNYKTLGERAGAEGTAVVGAMRAIQLAGNALDKTIVGLLAQKGPLGVAGIVGLETAFTALGDEGLISDKEKAEFKAMYDEAALVATSPERRAELADAMIKGLTEGKDTAIENLGLGGLIEDIKSKVSMPGFGEIGANVKNWYRDWKSDIFGEPELTPEQEEMTDSIRSISQEIASLTAVINQQGVHAQQYHRDRLADAQVRKQLAEEDLEASQTVASAVTKPQIGSGKGEAAGPMGMLQNQFR